MADDERKSSLAAYRVAVFVEIVAFRLAGCRIDVTNFEFERRRKRALLPAVFGPRNEHISGADLRVGQFGQRYHFADTPSLVVAGLQRNAHIFEQLIVQRIATVKLKSVKAAGWRAAGVSMGSNLKDDRISEYVLYAGDIVLGDRLGQIDRFGRDQQRTQVGELGNGGELL